MSTSHERETTYDVRVWKVEKVQGKKAASYKVVWIVAGRRRKESFGTDALADSFRAELLTATRKGEAFDVATGLPVSKVRAELSTVFWYNFACKYVDMKWSRISAKYRKGVAEAFVTVTCALLTEPVPPDQAVQIRSALLNWGFNAQRRGSESQPDDVSKRLNWVAGHTPPVGALSRPEVLRRVLDALALRLDGKEAAGRTTHRKRAVLSNALAYAVELGLLTVNPVQSVKWQAPRSTQVVDRRSVANPTQARALLDAVRMTKRSGKRLVAFFACMYYSALRPEETVNVRKHWLDLPEDVGWGWMILEGSAPEVEPHWSDSNQRRDERQLKHRAVGETRRVPVPPVLGVILKEHLAEFGTDKEGRLFWGEQGGVLAGVTYLRVWDRARRRALTEDQYASPLARRPYDLRHACVSTWLSGGVAPTQVAEWAGHSVDVLLKIYAKCLDGQEHVALRRIDQVLSEPQSAAGETAEPGPGQPPLEPPGGT